MGKCSIFGVEVDYIQHNKKKNILQVTKLEEVFFDIYQCEYNGKAILLEKTGTLDGMPVVTCMVEIDNNVYCCKSILTEGEEPKFYLNKNTLLFEKNIPKKNLVEKVSVKSTKEEVPEETVYIDRTKELASKMINDYEKEAINLLNEKIEKYKKEKNNTLLEMQSFLDNKTDDIKNKFGQQFIEYIEINDKKINSLFEDSTDNIKAVIERNVREVKDKLLTEIHDINTTTLDIQQHFNEKIEIISNKVTEDISLFEDKLKIILNDSTERIKRLKSRIEKREKALISAFNEKIEQQNKQNQTLLKEGVRDAIVYGDKKITKLNKDIDELNRQNNLVKKYISESLKVFEEDSKLQNKVIIENINGIIASLNNKSSDEYKKVLNEKVNSIELLGLKNELLKDIQKDYKNEISSLKRYAELVSGGGSVAVQYADGGFMGGDLTVYGTISALNIAGLENVAGNYLPLSGGTVNGDVTVNGVLSATLIEATSAIFQVIDIKQYELSGFDVTGNASISGNLNVDGVFTNNNLQYPLTDGNPYDVLTTNGSNTLTFEPANKITIVNSLPYDATNSNTYTFIVSSDLSSSFTLPQASFYTDRVLNIKKVGTGTLTISGNSGELIDKQTSEEIINLDNITLHSTGNEWFILSIYGPVLGV